MTLNRALISTYIEWIVRVSFICVSIFQFLIITSRTGKYCANTLGLLSLESNWILTLVTVQLLKVIVFSLWQLMLHSKDFNEDERISTIRSSRPTEAIMD